MRLPLLFNLNLLLLFFAAQKISAQLLPADDFFNGGAQFYISNNIPAALKKTEDGLKIYPDDEKLKKLEQLLKQQQQNQQQQQQQSKNDRQKNQQSQQNQQNQSQQQKDRQKQDEQNKSEQQKQQAQQSAAGKQKADEEKKQQGEGQPLKPGQMTPEEAKHLLDAQKGDEQVLQLKPKEKSELSQQPVKDW